MEDAAAAAASAEEGTPLMPSKDRAAAWPRWRVAICVVNGLTYIVGAMPVAINIPLAIILEGDGSIEWTKTDSRLLLSANRISEGIGLVLLGPLADYWGGSAALSLYFSCASFLMVVMSSAREAELMLVCYMICAMVRGIAWPAATKLVSDNLTASQWEIGICSLAIASRTGAMMTSDVIGGFAKSIGWRLTLGIVATLLALSFAAMRMVMRYTPCEHKPPVSSEQGLSNLSPLALIGALGRHLEAVARGTLEFLSCDESWLVLALVVLQQPLLAFGDFLGTFAHDIFLMSYSNSALVSGAFPVGQLIGLVLVLLMVLFGGRQTRRPLYKAIAVLSVGAAIIPAWLRLSVGRVSSTEFVVLAVLQGFCSVAMDYFPSTMWCMHLGRKNGNGSAMYMSALFGFGYAVSFCYNYVIGLVRSTSVEVAFNVVMSVASCCALLSAMLLARHASRNDDLFADA